MKSTSRTWKSLCCKSKSVRDLLWRWSLLFRTWLTTAPCRKKKQDVNAFFEADGPAALTWLYQVRKLRPRQLSRAVMWFTQFCLYRSLKVFPPMSRSCTYPRFRYVKICIKTTWPVTLSEVIDTQCCVAEGASFKQIGVFLEVQPKGCQWQDMWARHSGWRAEQGKPW